jgi:hypothetical protein
MSIQMDEIDELDRRLDDIRLMGQIAIQAAQNLRREDDTDHYRLSEQDTELLIFSVHDVLDRIEKLRAELEVAAESAKVVKAVPDPARPDLGRSGADKHRCGWRGAYFGLEADLHDVVLMLQIAAELVFEANLEDNQVSFAVFHSRRMLDDFLKRYLETLEQQRAADS